MRLCFCRMNTVGSDQLTLEIEFFEFTVANLIAKRAETHGVLRRATGRLKSCIVGDSPSHSKHSKLPCDAPSGIAVDRVFL